MEFIRYPSNWSSSLNFGHFGQRSKITASALRSNLSRSEVIERLFAGVEKCDGLPESEHQHIMRKHVKAYSMCFVFPRHSCWPLALIAKTSANGSDALAKSLLDRFLQSQTHEIFYNDVTRWERNDDQGHQSSDRFHKKAH